MKRVPHPRMSFRQPDHRLELPRRSRDPPLVGPRVRSDIPHLNVRLDERVRGFLTQDGMNVVARPRDVRGEILNFLRVITRLEQSQVSG